MVDQNNAFTESVESPTLAVYYRGLLSFSILDHQLLKVIDFLLVHSSESSDISLGGARLTIARNHIIELCESYGVTIPEIGSSTINPEISDFLGFLIERSIKVKSECHADLIDFKNEGGKNIEIPKIFHAAIQVFAKKYHKIISGEFSEPPFTESISEDFFSNNEGIEQEHPLQSLQNPAYFIASIIESILTEFFYKEYVKLYDLIIHLAQNEPNFFPLKSTRLYDEFDSLMQVAHIMNKKALKRDKCVIPYEKTKYQEDDIEHMAIEEISANLARVRRFINEIIHQWKKLGINIPLEHFPYLNYQIGLS